MAEGHLALREDSVIEEVFALPQAHHDGAAGVFLHQVAENRAECNRIFFVVDKADQRHGAGAQNAAAMGFRHIGFGGIDGRLRPASPWKSRVRPTP